MRRCVIFWMCLYIFIHALEHARDSSLLRGFALIREASEARSIVCRRHAWARKRFKFVRLVVSARTSAHGLAAGARGCSGQFSPPNVSSRPDYFANRRHKPLHAKREHGVEYTAPKTDALVTLEANKEMSDYIYSEMCENMYMFSHVLMFSRSCFDTKPHLISVAKAVLEANSQRASKKQHCFSPPSSLLECHEECLRSRAGPANGPAGYAACLRWCAKNSPQWDRILNRNLHSGCTPGIVVEAEGVQSLSHDEDEKEGESLAEIIEEEGMEDEEERDKKEQEREQEQELGRERATETREAMSQRSTQGDRAIKEATGMSRLPPNAFTLTHSAIPGPPSLSKAEALERYACGVSGDTCETVCGDGLRVGSENCDDGNSADGDGCSSTCEVEAEWICSMARSDTNGRFLGEDGPHSTCARSVVVTMSHRSPQEDEVIKALLEGAEHHEQRAVRERERSKPLHEGAD